MSGPDRELRAAMLAAALADAVRAGSVVAADALRVLRHELRIRNTRRAHLLPVRSQAAQDVLDRHAASGTDRPRNGSPDALHADHVYALTEARLHACVGVEAWQAALAELSQVVCVTAQENYTLEQLERQGADGWDKYVRAGIRWASPPPHLMTALADAPPG